EFGRIKYGLDTAQVLPQQVGARANVQTYVVALRFDPVDLLRSDEFAAVARGYRQPLQEPAIPAHLPEQGAQPVLQVGSLLLTDALACALQCRLETLVVE